MKNNNVLPKVEQEIKLPSLKIVDKEFLDDINLGI